MGIFDFKQQVHTALGGKPNIVLGITEIGIDRIEKSFGTSPELHILQKLHENGPMSFSEIARSTGLDIDTVKVVTYSLNTKGAVMKRV